MGIQCMMCKFVSFTVSTVPAYSSSFHPGEQWPNPAISSNYQTHILIFSGDLLVLWVSASGFTVSLPSPPSGRPFCIWAVGLRAGLNIPKVIFRKGRGPTVTVLLFLFSWDPADIWWRRKCVTLDWAQRANRGTPESRLDSECKVFCGDFAPVLQAGSSQ